MDEIARFRSFRAAAADPSPEAVTAARKRLLAHADPARANIRLRPRGRRALAVALAAACLVGVAAAFGASQILKSDVLRGPAAPTENEAALQALFPPLDIGRATELAEHAGRTLFGARTARGGYCFSATSPVDPKGEGGHCVSAAEARTLDGGGTVAFAMSGWSVGGYAPGASKVHVSGAGIDVTVPVSKNGWWVGVARLPLTTLRDAIEGTVVATGVGPDGDVLGRDPLMRVQRRNDGKGHTAVAIAFV